MCFLGLFKTACAADNDGGVCVALVYFVRVLSYVTVSSDGVPLPLVCGEYVLDVVYRTFGGKICPGIYAVIFVLDA